MSRQKVVRREANRQAYTIAALAAKACLSKDGLGSFESVFPEKPTAERMHAEADFASRLMKNMKIATPTPEAIEKRKANLRSLEAKRKGPKKKNGR